MSVFSSRQRIQLAWRERLNTADLKLVAAALLVGAGTGMGAVIFIRMLGVIGSVTEWSIDTFGLTIGRLLLMAVAGLVVGFIVERWATEAKGHGVPEVMEAVALRGGRIRTRVAAIKVLASSITIGSGGSAGREGPIVQVGSALGSTVAQRLRMSEERVRTLVACGAAAGIAATFNAPIAGSIFALEIILGRFTVRYFGMVVLSAVSGSIVARVFLSDQPAFNVPAYPLGHLGEIPIYVALSVLSALLAVTFIRVLYAAEGFFDGWRIPLAFKAALGMVLTGIIGLLMPNQEVLGPGLHLIGEMIAGNVEISLRMMAALLVLKLAATTFTLGSGNSGGVFAPGLFMGAVLGAIVGTIANSIWPDVAVNPGAYALVGMAATFAGAARAPITAILIVFEMSGDYKLILPLMMATVISTLLAELLFSESIYTLKLKLRGIRLQSGRDVDVLDGVTVGEVMETDFDTISTDETVAELSVRLSHSHHHGFPVIDEQGKLAGIVTLTDLDRAVSGNFPDDTPAFRFATPRNELVTIYPDESIGEALRRLGGRGFGRLPVVARDNPNQLLGLIRRAGIVHAYNIGLTRRADIQHRTKQMEVSNIDGTEFVDVVISADDAARGRTIQQLAVSFPRDCVLVSVRRGGRLLIPHGSTRLEAGDRITAFVSRLDRDAYLACLRGRQAGEQTPST